MFFFRVPSVGRVCRSRKYLLTCGSISISASSAMRPTPLPASPPSHAGPPISPISPISLRQFCSITLHFGLSFATTPSPTPHSHTPFLSFSHPLLLLFYYAIEYTFSHSLFFTTTNSLISSLQLFSSCLVSFPRFDSTSSLSPPIRCRPPSPRPPLTTC
jgi:hypothetical protein